MTSEAKVIICIIATIWLFGMGVLAGEYFHSAPSAEPTAGQESTTSADSTGGYVYVTDAQGQPVTDASGQPVTSQPAQTEQAGSQTVVIVTEYVTDSSGQTVLDEAGQPVTQQATQVVGQTETITSPASAAQEQPTGSQPAGSQPAGSQPATTQGSVSPNGLTDGRQCADVQTLKTGRFYITGSQYSPSDQSSIEMVLAADGENTQVFTQISGVDISVMIIDGVMYMVYNGGYVTLSETMMNTIGVDLDEMMFDASFLTDLFPPEPQATVEYDTLDDQQVVKTTYVIEKTNEEGETKRVKVILYTSGDKLLRIDEYNADTGECSGIIYVNSISGTIPSGYLTTDGLTKKNFITFFKELIAATGEDIGDLGTTE